MTERCKSFTSGERLGQCREAVKHLPMQIEGGRYAELHNVLAMVPKSIALAYRLRENSNPERDPRFAR